MCEIGSSGSGGIPQPPPSQSTGVAGASGAATPPSSPTAPPGAGSGPVPSASSQATTGAASIGGGGSDLASALSGLVASLQQVISALGANPIGTIPADRIPSSSPLRSLPPDVASIDLLAEGYLDKRHDRNGDGAISIGTEDRRFDRGTFLGPDSYMFNSSFAMSTVADRLGNGDGKVTQREYRDLLATFDTGDGTSGTKGDGLLTGSELTTWMQSGVAGSKETVFAPGASELAKQARAAAMLEDQQTMVDGFLQTRGR